MFVDTAFDVDRFKVAILGRVSGRRGISLFSFGINATQAGS